MSVAAALSLVAFLFVWSSYISMNGGASGATHSNDGLSPYQFTSPSNCGEYGDCESYCSDPSHYDECARFFSQRSSDADVKPEGNISFVSGTAE